MSVHEFHVVRQKAMEIADVLKRGQWSAIELESLEELFEILVKLTRETRNSGPMVFSPAAFAPPARQRADDPTRN